MTLDTCVAEEVALKPAMLPRSIANEGFVHADDGINATMQDAIKVFWEYLFREEAKVQR